MGCERLDEPLDIEPDRVGQVDVRGELHLDRGEYLEAGTPVRVVEVQRSGRLLVAPLEDTSGLQPPRSLEPRPQTP